MMEFKSSNDAPSLSPTSQDIYITYKTSFFFCTPHSIRMTKKKTLVCYMGQKVYKLYVYKQSLLISITSYVTNRRNLTGNLLCENSQ
jgi:hypothetical protein